GYSGGIAAPNSAYVLPIYCRRDDYAFLPPQAISGIPCDNISSGDSTDPSRVARAQWDHMELPSLQLRFNPRLGMVAVPTWFWVDGYGGDVIRRDNTLLLTH